MTDRANILIVDDRPEKVLALEAVLEDLDQQIVRAYSGREALRQVLQREFAVILLDVNMPGMDGFETASLIRQRKSSEHTPIIFVTAFGDEMRESRGYSLGAVDYILAPVMPAVLRTKVAVFVDLFLKSQQLKRQTEWLRQRAAQLHKLTRASLAINAAMSMEALLRIVAETSREVIGAHQASITTTADTTQPKPQRFVTFSPKYADCEGGAFTEAEEAGLVELVCGDNTPIRLTVNELDRRISARQPLRLAEAAPAMRGWLAAPLTGRDGRNIGLLQLSERADGEFSDDDEAVLVQLAQMASIAIENTLFSQEREANRLKDEFLATLSHELRTPLSAILGWTQLLQTGSERIDLGHALKVIERNVKAQTKLVEDLLDVSRITTGKLRVSLKPLSLGPIVAGAADAIRPAADAKGVVVEGRYSSVADSVVGDADRLQQVVWNLLSNAVKFTPEGGKVRVAMDRDDRFVRITVSDTGQGIAPAFLPHVFDRFRQADSTTTRSHGGLGIGLTIVRHIVELHGGSVQAESDGEGSGATFIVRLPFRDVKQESASHSDAGTGPLQGAALRLTNGEASPDGLEGVHVLLAEDNHDARHLIAEVLRRAGAAVTEAASVAEAFTAFQARPPTLVISDIAMPGEDGYSLLRRIRALEPSKGGEVPVIAFTAYAQERDRNRIAAAGFAGHLSKPVAPCEVIAVVEQALHSVASNPAKGSARASVAR